MTRVLSIYWNADLVGELRQERFLLAFRYIPAYLSSPAALPLSRNLPLQNDPFNDSPTRAFFENLLPEGGIRAQVARQVGVSKENVFGLLEAIGGDCAGAISIVPPGGCRGGEGRYRPISKTELGSELSNLPAHPFLAGEEGVRLSLAGAQNKLPIYYDGSDFFIPEGNYPSSHILKTAILPLENTVVNEAFCMNLAKRVGLKVPPAVVVDINGQQVYMVERYDRRPDASGRVLRIHQEDFCQALGIPSDLKYEKEGGPGFHDCFKLVEDWSDEPFLDNESLLVWALFNFLTGNADAHGKNLSFLYAKGTVRLAPFYDLISTAVYERVNNKFAMKMGGQKDPRYFMADDLERFASETGIELRAVKAELKQLIQRLEETTGPLAKEYREECQSVVILERIQGVISQRIGKAKTLL